MPRTPPPAKQPESGTPKEAIPELDIPRTIGDVGKETVVSMLKAQIKDWTKTRAHFEIVYDVHRRIKSQRLQEFETELENCGPAITRLKELLAQAEAYQEPDDEQMLAEAEAYQEPDDEEQAGP